MGDIRQRRDDDAGAIASAVSHRNRLSLSPRARAGTQASRAEAAESTPGANAALAGDCARSERPCRTLPMTEYATGIGRDRAAVSARQAVTIPCPCPA